MEIAGGDASGEFWAIGAVVISAIAFSSVRHHQAKGAEPELKIQNDQSIVWVIGQTSANLGLVMSSNGEVLTSARLLQGLPDYLRIVLPSSRGEKEVKGVVKRVDAGLVLLTCPGCSGLPPFPLGKGLPAAGAEASLLKKERRIPAALQRVHLGASLYASDNRNFLQTDVDVTADNGFGPLLDSQGSLIAVLNGEQAGSNLLALPTEYLTDAPGVLADPKKPRSTASLEVTAAECAAHFYGVAWRLSLPPSRRYSPADRFELVLGSRQGNSESVALGHLQPITVSSDFTTYVFQSSGRISEAMSAGGVAWARIRFNNESFTDPRVFGPYVSQQNVRLGITPSKLPQPIPEN